MHVGGEVPGIMIRLTLDMLFGLILMCVSGTRFYWTAQMYVARGAMDYWYICLGIVGFVWLVWAFDRYTEENGLILHR